MRRGGRTRHTKCPRGAIPWRMQGTGMKVHWSPMVNTHKEEKVRSRLVCARTSVSEVHHHVPCTICRHHYRSPLQCMITAQHGRVRWSCLLSKLASREIRIFLCLFWYVRLVHTMTNTAFLLVSHDNLFLGTVSALPKSLSEAMLCVTQASCRRILGRRLWRCVVFQFQQRHGVERRSTGRSSRTIAKRSWRSLQTRERECLAV